MSRLRKLQQAFKNYELGQASDIQSYIAGPDSDYKDHRLSIYREAYGIRLREILANDFPVLKALVGEESFYALADRYIDSFPGDNPVVRYFTQNFPVSLQDQALAWFETALFESAMDGVIDAADAELATPEALQAVPPDEWGLLKFEFHPSVRLLTLHCNVPEVWLAYHHGNAVSELQSLNQPTQFLLWRQDMQAYYRELDRAESLFVRSVLAGDDYATACMQLAEVVGDEQAAAESIGYLLGYFQSLLLSSIQGVAPL